VQAAVQKENPDQVEALRVFPGTAESKILLPLDYPPSANYQPRWGYSKPAHKALAAKMEEGLVGYIKLLTEVVGFRDKFSEIPAIFDHVHPELAGWTSGSLSPLDAALLYYFLVKNAASRYVEIGSGVSTAFAYRAKRDNNLPTRILSIDPEPRARVEEVCDRRFISSLEEADLELFDHLWPGDVVFFDGGHRCFMNSDVTVFFLDVLPRLRPGVLVGIHAIYWPDDYPPNFAHAYWSEQYILAAFLLGAGDKVRIEMPSAIIHKHPALANIMRNGMKGIVPDANLFVYGGTLWFTMAPSV